jgi:antitoxin VapB
MKTAKVFWSGRSQAVRLPKELRVDCSELRVRRRGHAIILEPIPKTWKWLDSIVEVDADFVEAALEKPQPSTYRIGSAIPEPTSESRISFAESVRSLKKRREA